MCGRNEFVLRCDRQDFPRSRIGGSFQQAEYGRGGFYESNFGRTCSRIMDEEQRGDCIPGAVDAERQLRRADAPVTPALPGNEIYCIRRHLARFDGGGQNNCRTEMMHGRDGFLDPCQGVRLDARQVFQFELVGVTMSAAGTA